MERHRGKTGQVGLADLTELGVLDDDPKSHRLAAFASYDYAPRPEEPKHPPSLPLDLSSSKPRLERPTYSDTALGQIPFLWPCNYTAYPQGDDPEGEIQTFKPRWTDPPAPLALIPLASKGRLTHLLQRFDLDTRKGHEIHIPQVIDQVSRLRPLARLPRLMHPAKGRVQILIDSSRHLVPVWQDQEQVVALMRATPEQGHRYWDFNSIDMRLQPFGGEDTAGHDPDPADGPLVVFGDLGTFGQGDLRAFWRDLGWRFRRAGGQVLAVVPCDVDSIPPDLARLWPAVEWEGGASSVPTDPSGASQAEELLSLCAPCARLEPALMRAIRRQCTDFGPEVELRLWKHSALASPHPLAASFEPEKIGHYRKEFARIAAREPDRAQRAWQCIRQGRIKIGSEFLFEEIYNLPPDVRQKLVSKQDANDADSFWSGIGAAVADKSLQPEAVAWLAETGYRNPIDSSELWNNPSADHALRKAVGQGTGNSLQTFQVSQSGEALYLGQDVIGSCLGTLRLQADVVDFVSVQTNTPPSLREFRDPLDEGGLGPVMISVPAGIFTLGSPEDEEGHWSNEGPQQEIRFGEPFALGKYPVTFAEYDAFCDATGQARVDDQGWGRGQRPAINLSWDDAQAYCQWLSEATGEDYHLPSEAQWEYACRAGTTTAYPWGEAWDPAMANGDREISQTSKVGAFPPNPWGFCDMNGNVDEWCADVWQDNHVGAAPDGTPRQLAREQSDLSVRVVRGGSWLDAARFCRSAARFRSHPGNRDGFLGFRLARGQGAPAGHRAERAGAAAAEPPLRRRLRPEAQSLAVPLADLPAAPFVIRTDCAELVVDRIHRNAAWASAMGRDPCGLWADIEVQDVRQRLRWCPPGQFQMGSPMGEPGRFDDYEGPVTNVTFQQGFWMFDTPVTQALYAAVTGENPSRFRSPTRPVEKVSWEDAQSFVERLNKMTGMTHGERSSGFHLPSEAQWEYACRAGTEQATWAGPMEIKGERNAAILNDIAWYGGNSGTDFELDNGFDSSDWSEKAFDHSKAGTMPTKLKSANPWGLYDTLGNVWEWCEDVWHETHEGAHDNGQARQPAQGDEATESHRVVRGGSWLDSAWYCRSAARNRLPPGDRNGYLGFRLARGQGAPASQRAERALQAGVAEPRPTREGATPELGSNALSRLWRRFRDQRDT